MHKKHSKNYKEMHVLNNYLQEIGISDLNLPGSFFGFLKGTNFAPIANAMEGPNIKPRASIPGE